VESPPKLVRARGRAASAVLAELGLASGRPVLVVAGGADTLKDEALARATAVVGPAVAAVVERTGAAVVDGGTASGIMRIAGEALHARDCDTVLIGVAPDGLVSAEPGTNGRMLLEPNHTHFALADSSEWGGETALLVELASALAGGEPVAVLVAGGGEVTKAEIRAATMRRWPVFLVRGTGGAADETAPDGAVAVTGDAGELARRLAWELQDLPVLKDAWQRFATFDAMANKARTGYERVQASILAVGILATFLALLADTLDLHAWRHDVLHWVVVGLPILGAILIGWAQRLASGKRWVLLRGAAETIKREIYRFRTATGVFAGDAPQAQLAERLETIESKLFQTEASSWELTPYAGPLPPQMYGASRDDDGLSPLSPEDYLALRVGDQLDYYYPKTRSLARSRRFFQLAALVAGGAGAILAAAGFEVWIGLTTALAGAALGYLGYLQVENTLVAYNQAAGRLEALKRGWKARPRTDDVSAAFEELVARAETVLETELGGWVQQMNDALEAQEAKQSKQARAAGDDETASPGGPTRTGSRNGS
jgi:SLOG in TRPM, prokaryote/SMODS and SLOG-associating 2TM effector domain 1/Protein of unknown function (DUF4231)